LIFFFIIKLSSDKYLTVLLAVANVSLWFVGCVLYSEAFIVCEEQLSCW